jgi:predicted metal-binding membrane protein
VNVRAVAVTPPRIRTTDRRDLNVVARRASPLAAIWMTIGGAWLVFVIAQVSGDAAALHHHALIEGQAPIAIAIATFLIAWLIMVVAMMWPASLHAADAFTHGNPDRERSTLVVAIFLGASAIAWLGFGLTAFIGDVGVHRVVDATPWLSSRPWLIEAGVLATAGAYQFLPLKRRYLAACRRPGDRTMFSGLFGPGAIRAGLRHGLDCLGSAWALMLVMFASGFASLWLMAALTLLMVYEAIGRHGERAASVAGVVLVLAALTALNV